MSLCRLFIMDLAFLSLGVEDYTPTAIHDTRLDLQLKEGHLRLVIITGVSKICPRAETNLRLRDE